MSDPAKKGTVKDLLHRYDFLIRKKFGQNFLVREDILDGIVEASGVTKEDFVLEIGPGLGTLTRRLSAAARRVVAVEISGICFRSWRRPCLIAGMPVCSVRTS